MKGTPINLHFAQLRFCGGFYPRETFFFVKIVVYIYIMDFNCRIYPVQFVKVAAIAV